MRSSASLYEVVPRSGVTTQMALAVLRAAERLFVTPSEAACLLRAYHWNRTKLEQDWYGNAEKVRRDSGVPEPLNLASWETAYAVFTLAPTANTGTAAGARVAASVSGAASGSGSGAAATGALSAPPSLGVASIVIPDLTATSSAAAAAVAAAAVGPIDVESLPPAPASVPTPPCAGARDTTFFYHAPSRALFVQCSTAYCDRVRVESAAALGCGHWFCSDCWQAFLASEIDTLGRSAVFTRCMGMVCTNASISHRHGLGCKCNALVPLEFFDRFVRRPTQLLMQQQLSAASSTSEAAGAADGSGSGSGAGAGAGAAADGAGAAAGGGGAPLLLRAGSFKRQQSLANAISESAAVAAAAAAAVVPGGKLLPSSLTRVPSTEMTAAATATAAAISNRHHSDSGDAGGGEGGADRTHGPVSSLFPAAHGLTFGAGANETGARLVERLESWVVDLYVDKTPGITWCPRPGCGPAKAAAAAAALISGADPMAAADAAAPGADMGGPDSGAFAIVDKSDGLLGILPVKCKCAHEFCFKCLQGPHVPAPCDIVAAWNARTNTDTSDLWILAQTKECPKCRVRIEKNRACNHMTCLNCRHQFCWLCLANWSEHNSSTGGSFTCLRYQQAVSKDGVSAAEKAQIELQQTLQKHSYYLARVQQHQQGAAFAVKLKADLEAQLHRVTGHVATRVLAQIAPAAVLPKGGSSAAAAAGLSTEAEAPAALATRFQFALDALDKVITARTVLRWSYVTAFYLKTNDTKRLFEMQQELLVNTVEQLQETLEDVLTDMVAVYRQKKAITDAVAGVESMRKFLTQHISSGDLENSLLYKEDAGTSTQTWMCRCGAESKEGVNVCVKCTACRRHGEPECKICQNMRL